MENHSLSDDPDWGHKPEDDNFVVDNNLMSYLHGCTNDFSTSSLPYEKAFERGVEFINSNSAYKARQEFRRGWEDYKCPRCAMMMGICIAEKLGERNSFGTIDYSVLADGNDPVPYLMHAIQAKIPEAAIAYSIYLAHGISIPADEKSSIKYMNKAAEWGHPMAKKVIEEFEKSRPTIWQSIRKGLSAGCAKAFSDIVSEGIDNSTGNYLSKIFGR